MMHVSVCAPVVRFSPSRFTGKERDQESGNDYFEARYFVNTLGRWLSPDTAMTMKGAINSWCCDPGANGFATINEYVVGLSGEQMSEWGVDPGTTAPAWQHTNVCA